MEFARSFAPGISPSARIDGPYVDEPRVPPSAWVAVVAALAIWIIDLCTSDINLSILYALTVLLFARTLRHARILTAAVVIVFLTYSGYLLGPKPPAAESLRDVLFNVRMLNRGMACVASLAVAVALSQWSRFEARMRRHFAERTLSDADQTTYDELILSFQQLTAGIICSILILAILVADIISPNSVNFPILYVVPLVVCLWSQTPRLMWTLTPLLVLLTLCGYFWDQRNGSMTAASVLHNRMIASFGILAIAVSTGVWSKLNRGRPSQGRSHPDR